MDEEQCQAFFTQSLEAGKGYDLRENLIRRIVATKRYDAPTGLELERLPAQLFAATDPFYTPFHKKTFHEYHHLEILKDLRLP
jgi:hypothetical protein